MRSTAEPKRPLLWSPDALADLGEIWRFYAHETGKQIADRILRDIERPSSLVQEYPAAGRPRPDVRPGLQFIAARPYLVFYRVVENGTQIVRVLHQRRDLGKIFAEESLD